MNLEWMSSKNAKGMRPTDSKRGRFKYGYQYSSCSIAGYHMMLITDGNGSFGISHIVSYLLMYYLEWVMLEHYCHTYNSPWLWFDFINSRCGEWHNMITSEVYCCEYGLTITYNLLVWNLLLWTLDGMNVGKWTPPTMVTCA